MPGPMTVGSGTHFQAIYDQFKPGMLGSGGDQNIRFKGDQLYVHSSFKLHGRGVEAAENRAAKFESGAVQVRQALVRDFGPVLADRILSSVGKEVGRNLSEGVTRSDLALIRAEAGRLVPTASEVVEVAVNRPTSKIAGDFRAHLKKEFSEENLDFTQAIVQMKNAPPQDQARLARAIFDNFVDNDKVNVPSRTRSDLRLAFAGDTPPGKDVFNTAFNDIWRLMVNDSATRYVRDL